MATARLDGRVAVVTGATSGLGKVIAGQLAEAGAHVVLAVRSPERGRTVSDEFLEGTPDASLEVRELDLASLDSVARFAEGLRSAHDRLDILVNNAGLMAPMAYTETADHFESQFGVNYLGHYALTARLWPLLLATPDARVAQMASPMAALGVINFSDPQWRRWRYPFAAYAQSKLASLLFSQWLAGRAGAEGWDVRSVAAHPGFARTNLEFAGPTLNRLIDRSALAQRVVFFPAQSAEEGARPMVHAVTAEGVANGDYYGPDGLGHLKGATTRLDLPFAARQPKIAARLIALSEELTGLAVGEEAA